jgi:hypothetical protein
MWFSVLVKDHYQAFFWVLIDLILELLGFDYQAL